MLTTIIIVTDLAVVTGAATGITTTNMPIADKSAETTDMKTGAFLTHHTTLTMQAAEVIASPTGVIMMTATKEITGTGNALMVMTGG
jgi:hypothetical protein